MFQKVVKLLSPLLKSFPRGVVTPAPPSENSACRGTVGFWMVQDQGDSRTTMRVDDGNGIITVNLIKALLASHESPGVTIVCLEEGRKELESTFGCVPKLKIFSQSKDGKIQSFTRTKPRNASGVTYATWEEFIPGLAFLSGFVQRYRNIRRPRALLHFLTFWCGGVIGKMLFSVWFPVFVILYIAEIYLGATAKLIARFTSPFIKAIQRRGIDWQETVPALREQLEEFARGAACTFWFIPSTLTVFPREIPTVLLTDDLPTDNHSQNPIVHGVIRDFRMAFANARKTQILLATGDCTNLLDLPNQLGLPESKFHVLDWAWPIEMPPGTHPRSAIKKWDRRPFIFFPATILPRKNIVRLIIALSTLRQQFKHHKLGLVLTNPGPFESSASFRAMIEALDLTQYVDFVGELERPEVTWLYQHASLTVIPSLQASRGLQIYEALEAGCPVVASQIPILTARASKLGIAGPFFNPIDTDDMARTIHSALLDREALAEKQLQSARLLSRRSWNKVAGELLSIGAKAAALFHDRSDLEPLSEIRVSHQGDPLRIFLMLQNPSYGGVWVAAKDLIENLVKLNRTRRELALTVALHPRQQGAGELRSLVQVETLQQGPCSARDVRFFADLDEREGGSGDYRSASDFHVITNASALRADAWFALLDRFPAPLLPDRPYGVVVHDMIQVHVPEAFGSDFFQVYRQAIIPTVRRADIVMTTSPVTRGDVVRHISNLRGQVELVPVCFEAHRRFEGLNPEPMLLPRTSFILNINNPSKHKGIEGMLRGHARLCQMLGSAAPLLVVAGPYTENYSLGLLGKTAEAIPHLEAVHELVKQLQLHEGRDVIYLGFLRDAQLLWLYQNCLMVVNSAKYDNGSYNLIEAHYFGKPTVSSRYPAAEWLYNRFKVPVRFFPVGDEAAMASTMQEALGATCGDLTSIRSALTNPELGSSIYAERVYNLLVTLGKKGRSLSHMKPIARVPTGKAWQPLSA